MSVENVPIEWGVNVHKGNSLMFLLKEEEDIREM